MLVVLRCINHVEVYIITVKTLSKEDFFPQVTLKPVCMLEGSHLERTARNHAFKIESVAKLCCFQCNDYHKCAN